jgi:hypothetical protein
MRWKKRIEHRDMKGELQEMGYVSFSLQAPKVKIDE